MRTVMLVLSDVTLRQDLPCVSNFLRRINVRTDNVTYDMT